MAATKSTQPKLYAKCKKRGYHRLTLSSGDYCADCGVHICVDDWGLRRG